MNLIDIKQESYLTPPFKIFGGILVLASILVLTTKEINFYTLLISIALFVLGLLTLTTRYGLIIDIDNRTYTIYTWVLGFKTGKPERINQIEKFYINEVTESGVATSRAGLQHEFSNKLFKAFMKLDNGEKIHVDTDKNYDELNKRVSGYMDLAKDLLT